MKKRWILLAMALSMVIALWWESIDTLREFIKSILDPLLLPLLSWNTTFGMLIVIGVLSFFMTLVQKYGTDQEEIREIKKQQKELQKEMKKYKDDPKKVMQLNQQQFEFMGKMMKNTMGTIVYTAVPIVLLFRWFGDYFSQIPDFRFLGFISWIWFYILCSIIFSSIYRKVLKVA